MARQKGFEPLTHGLEGRCSIQLSYWRNLRRKQENCSRRQYDIIASFSNFVYSGFRNKPIFYLEALYCTRKGAREGREVTRMLRKAAALLAALLLMLVPACAESLCLVNELCVALIDENGAQLLAGDAIEDVFAVRPGQLYAAGRRGDYGLYDAGGAPLGQARFSMIDDEGDCLIFRAGGLCGAMNDAGQVTLPALYTQLTSDGEGGFLALDSDPLDDRPDEIIHVAADGSARRTGVYTACGLSRVRSGRMPYMDEGGRYGAVNARGEIVIAPEWLYIGPFQDGAARMTGSDGVGLIDADGAVVLAAEYDWLDRGGTLLAALSGGGVEAYAPDGGVRLFAVAGENLSASLVGDCLLIDDGERARLYDATGRVVSESGAGTRYAPGTSGQFIASDGDWGDACQYLVDADGSAASGRYQFILPLCEGLYAWLRLEGAEYYSADLDRLQMSWNYDGARWGMMDAGGVERLNAKYREIRALSRDRLLLISEEELVLADRDGNAIRTWPTAEAEAPSGEAGA